MIYDKDLVSECLPTYDDMVQINVYRKGKLIKSVIVDEVTFKQALRKVHILSKRFEEK